MRREDAVRLIQMRMGNRFNFDPTVIAYAMVAVQSDVMEAYSDFVPWFMEGPASFVSTVADQEWVPLPDDFSTEIEGEFPYWIPQEGTVSPGPRRMKRVGQNPIFPTVSQLGDLQYNPLNPQAYDPTPRYYDLGMEDDRIVLRIYPKPDREWVINLPRYARRAADLSTGNIENAWLKHAPLLFVAETTRYLVVNFLQDYEQGEVVANEAKGLWDKLFKTSEYRRHVNQDYQAVGDLDGKTDYVKIP